MNEEISLREIIDIILKQKWTIIIFTIVCMLISAIFSFFILSPTYETYSIVRVQSSTQEAGKSAIDIKHFEESLKSASTLNSLIEKNDLDRKEYTINDIREMFKLEVIKDSNIMKINVSGDNPHKISRMANMLAYELGVRVEITDRTNEIVESQKRLEELNNQIIIAKTRLEESQNQLNNTPEKQVTIQALANDDLLRALEQEQRNSSVEDTARLQMQSENINPVYNDLKSKVAQATIELNTLETEAETLQEKIDSNMKRINELEMRASNDKLEINKSIRILDGTNAIFINPSIQPDSPVGPKKLLNIVIAAIVGAMMSLLYVFLRHYMKNTSTEVARSVQDV